MNATINVNREAARSLAEAARATEAFAGALLHGDCEAVVRAFYCDGARLVPPDSSPVVGRDPILRYWTRTAEARPVQAEFRVSRVEEAGPDAIGVGRYSLEFGSGKTESGAFAIRYRLLTDGTWRAAEEVFYRDVPA